MHIRCSTENAILIVGVFDAKKVMRFPDDGHVHGGILLQPKRGLPIDPQLVDAALKALDQSVPPTAFSIYQEFAEVVSLPEVGDVTVYLGLINEEALTATSEWASFPDIIRRLPKDRTRLPYLKAWQVLTGGLKLDTRAIENADLESLLSSDPSES